MGNKGSRTSDDEDDIFDTNAPSPARGRGSVGEDELAQMSLRKRIKKKKRDTEIQESPTVAPVPERKVVEEIDPTKHVILKLVYDAVGEISDVCYELAEDLRRPNKVPTEVLQLTKEVALLDVHATTIRDALSPIFRHPGARIDLSFNNQTLIVGDEVRQALEAVKEGQVPESAFGYVGYVAFYFAGTDIGEAARRLKEQRRLYIKLWNKSFKAVVSRMERNLTYDDSRLAELEQYSEQHGVDLPKEYFELVKQYDASTKSLLEAIHMNTIGMEKLRRREKRLNAEEEKGNLASAFARPAAPAK